MFTLMASHDAGCTYCPEKQAETVEELRPSMERLDAELMRWYLDKDGARYWEEECAIHRGLLDHILAVRGQQRQPPECKEQEKEA